MARIVGWVLAVAGALFLPLLGMVAVMGSDPCGGDENEGWICDAGNQEIVTWVALAGGPALVLAGVLLAWLRPDARRAAPWLVLLAQAVTGMFLLSAAGSAS